MSMNRREFFEGPSKLLSANLLRAGAAAGSEAATAAPQPQAAKKKFRLIDTEVHFSFPEHTEALHRRQGLFLPS